MFLMVNLTINGQKVEAVENSTILEAARLANIEIPTLCFLKGINEVGDCRMCVVEVEGRRNFATACITKVEEGMVVNTNSPKVIEARKLVLDLILSNHNRECLTCSRNGNCELQSLAEKFGMSKIEYEGERIPYEIDEVSPSIVRDLSKCILCRRCVATCKNVQGIGAIDSTNRGFNSKITTAGDKTINDVNCTFCGQCIQSCPVGALREKDTTDVVWSKILDPETYVVVQTAPAVRAALGEEFGMEIGTNVTGKMVTALRNLGFDKVFDTNTAADLTIMEEGNEFLERLNNNGTLPMITSCSPGWVRYSEMYYPELLNHLSTCKSPHQMFGAMLKSYYAEKQGIDPKKMFVVSVMPCVAKKYESSREEMIEDVDAVITTRELAKMIKQAQMDFVNLPDSGFDSPMGEATGAGAIFGTTGGVMEAALRTLEEKLTGNTFAKLEYEPVRGEQGIKRATLNLNGKEVKVVVASGLKNAQTIMDEIKEGKADYQFVEIMACPGGCVMGGGQPIKSSKVRATVDVRAKRAGCLYSIDEASTIRKSHENPVIKDMYENYLGEVGGEKAHHLLHTTYSKKEKYND
ncbi:MAG: iron hydrogenase small subunit [Clostridia bacterium]|nr:iron hydrogenase small subunit [Clostridia bacterium]